MKSNPVPRPAWFQNEHAMEFREDVPFLLFAIDGDVGIALHDTETPIPVKADEAALLFGNDPDQLVFRASFQSFYKVALDASDQDCARQLYGNSSGLFRRISPTVDSTFPVPVYHRALDMTPADSARGETETSAFPTCLGGIVEAVDETVRLYKGRVLARCRPANMHAYDLIALKGRCAVVTYADFPGDWFADEETFAGMDEPLWFSELEHRPSPVRQSKRCRDFLAREFPGLDILSIVILPKECTVVNYEEEQSLWKDRYGTTVLQVGGAQCPILTFHDFWASSPPVELTLPRQASRLLKRIARRFPAEGA